MYEEHLDDDYGHGAAAPAAFAQQDNYDIEMDRYRAQSQINSQSHGNYGNQQPIANNVNYSADAGFNDAVILDDAGSAHEYNNELRIDKELPNMGNHQYYRSGSIRDIDSPRDQWAANPNAPDPTQGLTCLWVIVVVVILGAIAAGTTIDHSMINVFIDMDFEGTYIWNLGWNDAKFMFMNNADPAQAPKYSSVTGAQIDFPIPNTFVYMKNAGYLLLGTILIGLFCIGYILTILCSRCNTHILLYINCCCCRIPQRASVYFAFDIIKTLSWATTMYYIVLGIYGLLETNFYLTKACPSGNTCWSYIVPHYGFFSLMCITFSISCCAFSKVQALDVKFNLKSMQLYYPENLRKAESRNCALKLDMLFSCIASIKNICILSFIMVVSFRDVGLISILFYNSTESTGTNAVMYFQFQGLTNSHGILKNSYIDALNGINGENDDLLVSTLEPVTNFQNEAAGFNTITDFWSYWIAIILIVNLFVFLPYIWVVIIKYSSIGICKFVIVLCTFIQWLVYSIFFILYYYEYYYVFNNFAQITLEQELLQTTGNDYNVSWFPDWGIIVAILLWFYLLRLMYSTFKAM